MSYSQNNEEDLIIGALDRAGITSGRFLDIGAHDGVFVSNTRRLAELGWRGVCVEASPYVFPKLVDTYRDNPNVELVNAAVSSAAEAELLRWYDSVVRSSDLFLLLNVF